MDYWRECIAEAFEDAKIEATDEQINAVASWVEGAHENYGLFTGYDVASTNFRAAEDREKADLRKTIQRERDKVMCKECCGEGRIVMNFGTRSSNSECWKCHGQGRHDP